MTSKEFVSKIKVCFIAMNNDFEKAFNKLEKELEVLEIIKTKKADTNHLWSLFKWDDDERALAEYNRYNVEQYELTEAEFKLLKEILENDK